MTSKEDITPINWEDVLMQNAELRAENERLRALIDAVHQHAHLKPGCPLCEALFGAGAQG